MNEILIYSNDFCYYEHTSKARYVNNKYDYYCNKYNNDSLTDIKSSYYKLLSNKIIRLNTSIYEILYTHAVSVFKQGIINNVVLSSNKKYIWLPYPLCKSYIPHNVWKLLINEHGCGILDVLPAKYKNKHTGQGYELYKLAYLKDNSLLDKHLTNIKIKINIKKDFNLLN
jgi:hypothetical protein